MQRESGNQCIITKVSGRQSLGAAVSGAASSLELP